MEMEMLEVAPRKEDVTNVVGEVIARPMADGGEMGGEEQMTSITTAARAAPTYHQE